MNILVGGRLDKHNMMDNIVFSPRANIRFSPVENIGLRVSYFSGFALSRLITKIYTLMHWTIRWQLFAWLLI